MCVFLSRVAAEVPLRGRWFRSVGLLFAVALLVLPANAVIVRGRVTDALGKPVMHARVQLILRGASAGVAFSDGEGRFEVRSSEAGRFALLTAATGFQPAVGVDFYGAAADVISQDVVVAVNTVQQEVSVTATGLLTPLPQLTQPVTLIAGEDFALRLDVVNELRQMPGVNVVQQGQIGGITSLFIRGGQSTSNKVLIDGVPAEDVGGRFDYGTVSSTGLGSVEIDRGPGSALYGSDALAGVVSLSTPRGETLRPVVNYSGDAGTLHTFRNEAVLSGERKKLDYLGGYSWLQTSNALPNDQYHSGTAVGNFGYALTDRTLARGTVRYGVSASGVPGAHDFFGLSSNAKQSDQDLYAQGTLENRTAAEWHNLVRYGVARKREQFTTLGPVGTAVSAFGSTTYYGNTVTIRGANGYTTTGSAAIAYAPLPAGYLLVSNRDELYFQSDKSFTRHFTGLFGFRYENERGAYHYPLFGTNQNLQRTNYQFNGQLQGDVKNRLFYSLGGAMEKNHLYGTRGTPRFGLAYAAVRPGAGWFRGTRLRANFARGVQEPDLNAQFGSLYTFLKTPSATYPNGNTAAIAGFGVTPIKALESRTYEAGIDQNVRPTIVVKAGYFHTQYGNQIEYVGSTALKMYFGFSPASCTPVAVPGCVTGFYGAYVNSLAYRAQGAEAEVQWQPRAHVFVRGGYTYLATYTERSFSGDALRAQGSTTNPLFPGVTIGASSPLIGARVFRRAPNTGYAAVNYTRNKFGLMVRAALSGKADDSTFLGGATRTFDNSLLLPNRDLDFAYAKLDVGGTYRVSDRMTVFVQGENVLNNQHIGPIGYPGLPATVRGGLKVRFGGE